MTKKIKLFDPVIDEHERKKIIEVLDSHFWASGAGIGYVEKFEKKFKNYINSDECIALNSGTSALNLALSIHDLKNKEVILPSLSFVSTAHTVIINGAKPIFVDVEPNSLCIDPEKIKKSITKKTAAILPVHFGGMPCNIFEIMKICKDNNLIMIEDAAHATGSSYKNKKIGKHGTAVCFSFHPVKNLAMPTGGLISINHKDHKKIRKSLLSKRWCGITDRKDANYDVKEMGWNNYMDEFSAAIGLEQLKKLEKLNKKRQIIAKKYSKQITLEKIMPFSKECSYHLFWIRVKNRTKFRKKLNERNIETGIHYRPIHTMTMYKNKIKLPVTEKIGQDVVSIPIHPNLSEHDTDIIIKNINEFS
jgi:dTDP-4-amino-4,6-dideoxygalactose transaminase